jgi:hypothetical protein
MGEDGRVSPLRSCLAVALVVALAAAGCGDDGAVPADPTGTAAGDARFPDVIDATVAPSGDGAFTVSATLSSPYDTPDRYADAWRVLAPDGTVLGVRELAHDHAAEQPFTRSLSGVEIPADVDVVTIEGRDLANGWGGATVDVAVDR